MDTLDENTNNRGFKVRDFRNKGFFILDDSYLNGYAKHLDPITTAVYLSLCRHADKEQSCFPSQELIAKEHGISRWTIRRRLDVLESWNIIKRERVRNSYGKWTHNVYYLLDKSVWKNPSQTNHGALEPHGSQAQATEQESHNKDTHKKGTHIEKEINKEKDLAIIKESISSLESISEQEFEDIAKKYEVPISFVISKYDDLVNYCQSTGKHYKNYSAALRNFVKKDALKIRKEASEHISRRGIDARGVK